MVHLDSWYAQSHPDEDFAETFAVWLTPDSNWRERYARLAGAAEARVRGRADAPDRRARRRAVTTRRTPFSLASQRRTLRVALPPQAPRTTASTHRDFYDRDLRALFSDAPEHARNPPAARVPDAHPPGGARPRAALDR